MVLSIRIAAKLQQENRPIGKFDSSEISKHDKFLLCNFTKFLIDKISWREWSKSRKKKFLTPLRMSIGNPEKIRTEKFLGSKTVVRRKYEISKFEHFPAIKPWPSGQGVWFWFGSAIPCYLRSRVPFPHDEEKKFLLFFCDFEQAVSRSHNCFGP